MAKDKTVDQYVDEIPEDMRGHVFHALGKKLGHGGAQPQDVGGNNPNDPGNPNSGDNRPPPPPPHG